MSKRVLRLGALLWIAIASAHPAAGGEWRSPGAVNSPGAPFVLEQLTAPSAFDCAASTEDGLRIRYAIHNTSAESLTHVGVEVVNLSATGEIKGYQIYEESARIEPGGRTSNTYTSAEFHVAAGDRLVMLPYSASGAALRWHVPDAELVKRTKSLTTAQGDTGTAAPAREVGCLEALFCGECRCGIASSFCESNASGSVTTVRCGCIDCSATRPGGSGHGDR